MSNTVEFFVCTSGRSCPTRGSCDVAARLQEAAVELGVDARVVVRKEGCLCLCRTGPTVHVMPGWHQYGAVTPADCRELVEAHVLRNEPVERLLINSKKRSEADKN